MRSSIGVLTGAALSLAYADKLSLDGDAQLTGTVCAIHETGVVELESTLSKERISLKAGSVKKVDFSSPQSSTPQPPALIELSNGDLLPAIIENLDREHLQILTQSAGKLIIPRTAIHSIQLGVHQAKSVYLGPKNGDDWDHDTDAAKRWKFSNGALTADGSAVASQTFELPQQFILSFTLKWTGNPNFQVYFADPLSSKNEASDRYYLQFNNAGLEIKRETNKGQRYQTVMTLTRTPDQFPDDKINLQIHVDRKSSRLQLFIDGELEATGIDPCPVPPQSGGFSFVNNAPSGTSLEIHQIKIQELDNVRSRHHAEDRGDPKYDNIISRDDDRWSGELTSISKDSQGTRYSFKSDFQKSPLELNEEDVSTVFFAQNKDAKPAQQEHSFALRLNGEGSLRVSSCSFSEDSILAQHPLLGSLKIDRNGIVAMEWLDSKPEVKEDE